MDVILYDVEAASPAEIARARAAARPGFAELAPQGCEVAAEGLRRLPAAKSNEFLNALMEWTEALFAGLRQAGLEERGWRRRGVCLLEVALYRFFYEASESLHRPWVLAQVLREEAPERLVWLVRPRSRSEAAALRRLSRQARLAGMDLRLLLLTPSLSPKAELRTAAGRALLPALDRFRSARRARRHARQPSGPREFPPNDGRPRVLFMDYYPNSVRASLPIARRLEAEHGAEVLWLAGRPPVAEALAAQGVKSFLPEEIAPPATFLEGTLGRRGAVALRRALGSLGSELLTGLAPDFAGDFVREVVLDRLAYAGDDAARWVETFHAVQERLAPRAVVTTTYSSTVGRASALVARQAGARAVYVQHGGYPDQAFNRFFCQDLLLLWGEYERRSLLRFGQPPETLRVTGATIYDALLSQPREPRPMPAPGEPLRLAFLASRTAGDVVTLGVATATLEAVVAAAEAVPGAELTVKTHPAEATRMPDDVLRRHPRFHLQRAGSSQELIAASDVILVQSSTTGFEACALGRPLIVFNLTGMEGYVEYARYGAALDVTAAEDLAGAILRVQADPAVRESLAAGRQRLLDEMLHGGRGDAAEVAARAVAEALASPGEAAEAKP